MVVLADNDEIKSKLAGLDIQVQTIMEVYPIVVHPARVLSKLYAHLGNASLLVV